MGAACDQSTRILSLCTHQEDQEIQGYRRIHSIHEYLGWFRGRVAKLALVVKMCHR